MSDTDIALQEDVSPATSVAVPSLLDNIMAQTRFQPASESYDIARQGVTAFIAALLQSDDDAESVDILAVNAMIADIDGVKTSSASQVAKVIPVPMSATSSSGQCFKSAIHHPSPRPITTCRPVSR